MEEIRPYRVLSLDGGGIRGLYVAAVFHSLLQRFSKGRTLDLGKGFDLIVGTSTGGIIAAALANGISIDQILALYQQEGPKIFKDPLPESTLRLLWWSFKNFNGSANSNLHLKKVLEGFFGQITIEEIWNNRKIGLCLTAVNLSTHKARVFKTCHFGNKNADDKRKLVDICLASSAAPIIFPISKLLHPDNQKSESFIDGGLWANNPILVALVEALEVTTIGQPIEIISVGTCPPVTAKIIDVTTESEGLKYWKVGINPLLAAMDSQANGHFHTANFLARNLTKHGKKVTIQRLHHSFPSAEQAKHLALDKAHPEAIQVLLDLATEDAMTINGKIENNEENYSILKDIFHNLPNL